MEANSKDKIPGIFLKNDLNTVKKAKGEVEYQKFAQSLPREFEVEKISNFKGYPVETEIKIIEEACKLLYGQTGPEAWEKWGRHDFETVKESTLGKVALSLYKNPEQIVKAGAQMLAFFNPLVKFSYENLTENGATAVVENNPYPPEYFKGLFESFVEFYGYEIKATVKVDPDNSKLVRYITTWKKK